MIVVGVSCDHANFAVVGEISPAGIAQDGEPYAAPSCAGRRRSPVVVRQARSATRAGECARVSMGSIFRLQLRWWPLAWTAWRRHLGPVLRGLLTRGWFRGPLPLPSRRTGSAEAADTKISSGARLGNELGKSLAGQGREVGLAAPGVSDGLTRIGWTNCGLTWRLALGPAGCSLGQVS